MHCRARLLAHHHATVFAPALKALAFAHLRRQFPQTRSATGLSECAAMVVSVRRQGSLAALMQDREDVFIAAVQAQDVPRIAELIRRGPPPIGTMPPRRSTELKQEAPQIVQRAATSSGEAVLQSLHASGLRRLEAAESAEEERRRMDQASYDALPAEEREAVRQERTERHMWEGLCAVNAVLRMKVEDSNTMCTYYTREDVDEASRVYQMMCELRAEMSAEKWAQEFLPELNELKVVLAAAG